MILLARENSIETEAVYQKENIDDDFNSIPWLHVAKPERLRGWRCIDLINYQPQTFRQGLEWQQSNE